MPTNKSNNEKTIRDEMLAMKSDVWNVDSFSTYNVYMDQVVLPSGFILDEYRDHFELSLEEIELDDKYHYSPTLFAEDYYGTADLWFLVLYFAKMKSLFEFNTPTIKVIPNSALVDLNKVLVKHSAEVKESRSNPDVFARLEDIEKEKKAYLSYTDDIPNN